MPDSYSQPIRDDQRLKPILAKVQNGDRLSFDDGVTLYSSHDLLAIGYMANIVRERLHGDTTYFNVNRHINPTDVCVASCRLCAFGKRAKDPKAYTMSLEEVWHKAGEGWSESVTEFQRLLADPAYQAYWSWAQKNALVPRLFAKLTGRSAPLIRLEPDSRVGPVA